MLNSILDFIKEILFKPALLFAAWVVGAVLLFAPSSYLNYLSLTWFRDEYRKWIGPATLIAFAAWLAQVGSYHLWPWMQSKRWTRTAKAESFEYINTLSPDEWDVLLACLAGDRRTTILPFHDSTASSLRMKGLLQPARHGTLLQYPHTIPKHVWMSLQSRRNQLLPANRGITK